MHEPEPTAQYASPRLHHTPTGLHLQPASAPPPGMLPAHYSLLSPGTEQRHLTGPPRPTGYMTFGRATADDGWTIAPVPHGAAFHPACPGTVTAPPGTTLAVAALARFQQMAHLGLAHLPATAPLHTALVIGSGPVALGCALELRRRSVLRIQVVTSRPHPPISAAPGVTCLPARQARPAPLVIDATGHPARAAALLAPGGTLGLLGTPGADAALPALAAHRHGWTTIGMHELAHHDPATYQAAYRTAATWLSDHLPPALADQWCRIIPGHHAPDLYRLLPTPARPAEPIILFDWNRP